jgi:hypothetical protein
MSLDPVEIALITDDSDQSSSVTAWHIRKGTQLMQYRGKSFCSTFSDFSSSDKQPTNFLISSSSFH